MDYHIEVIDPAGRSVARYDEVPILELRREGPDGQDSIRGLLPDTIDAIGVGYRLRAFVNGQRFCEAPVTRTGPMWSDTRKLILEDYVRFHAVVEVEAVGPARVGNTAVSGAYINRRVGDIVRDVINRAPGPIHYTVDHTAYPEGAGREYVKFLIRQEPENELGIAGTDTGQWVGADRIDSSGAYAKDGDTIAGLVVDGEPWPDLRMMMIDTEETSRNNHAVLRHPEVAAWSNARYERSGYYHKALAARDALQALIDTHGISHIELNPHRDSTGAFDDRVDAYGRYIGLVYGGLQCFNAALVEQGLSDVYLYEEGRYHLPEMQLKDYFSYTGVHTDSVEQADAVLTEFDLSGGVLEMLTALAYAGGGYIFDMSPDGTVRFRKPTRADRVIFYDPVTTGVRFGSDTTDLANIIRFEGNPLLGNVSRTYVDGASIDRYDTATRVFRFFSIENTADADQVMEGALRDLAWPSPTGVVFRFQGDSDLRPGQLLALRGAPLRRLDPLPEGAWGGQFSEEMIARVATVTHKLTGRHAYTEATLMSPLRSVANPLSFIVRNQEPASRLFEFRLDDARVGLDSSFRLD